MLAYCVSTIRLASPRRCLFSVLMGTNKLAQYLVAVRRDVDSVGKETVVEKLQVGFSQDRH